MASIHTGSTWKNGGGGGSVDAPVKADMKRGKAGLTLRVPGRILLNVWRTMRHEVGGAFVLPACVWVGLSLYCA